MHIHGQHLHHLLLHVLQVLCYKVQGLKFHLRVACLHCLGAVKRLPLRHVRLAVLTIKYIILVFHVQFKLQWEKYCIQKNTLGENISLVKFSTDLIFVGQAMWLFSVALITTCNQIFVHLLFTGRAPMKISLPQHFLRLRRTKMGRDFKVILWQKSWHSKDNSCLSKNRGKLTQPSIENKTYFSNTSRNCKIREGNRFCLEVVCTI